MKFYSCVSIVCLCFKIGSAFSQDNLYTQSNEKFQLTTKGASYLSSLPLRCMEKEYPYKTGITFLDSSFIVPPKDYHPAFYGCYDWHSSVHGHWMLIKLLKEFPGMPGAEKIKSKLSTHLTA